MQVRIKYERRFGDQMDPCRAIAHVQGNDFLQIGPTWEKAKQRLLESIKAWFAVDVPPPEVVELDLSSHIDSHSIAASQAEELAEVIA